MSVSIEVFICWPGCSYDTRQLLLFSVGCKAGRKGQQHILGVDDTWYPTQDTQTDVDEEITAASGAHEDTHEGEEEGDDDFAAAAVVRFD